ncbi:hypothetical protein NQZ79_g1141 [Umbelopsis isabellina]|nr:hypothetical protein NQZ79_g1141 [Umbelopsis isabellina]
MAKKSGSASKKLSESDKNLINPKGHFSMVRNFQLADLITLLNGVCGAMSILTNMRYLVSNDPNDLYTAMGFMPFGLFFDFMDGRVARWRNRSSLLGQELDSLADVISFGVAPAALAFALGMRTTLDTLILTYFVSCGIARLARFNATVALLPKDSTGKISHFEGLPIPSSLGLVAVLAYLVIGKGQLHADEFPYGVIDLAGLVGIDSKLGQVHAFTLLFAVQGTAMVSKTLRIPKP